MYIACTTEENVRIFINMSNVEYFYYDGSKTAISVKGKEILVVGNLVKELTEIIRTLGSNIKFLGG